MSLSIGQQIHQGEHCWHVLAAPGHDPHSVVLFDSQEGILLSADALWASGFGVVFPELEGIDAFDAVADTLSLIESLPVSMVVPGMVPHSAKSPWR